MRLISWMVPLLAVGVAAVLAPACSDDPVTPGTRFDAGADVGPLDSGGATADSGDEAFDTGVEAPDAGTEPPDAGTAACVATEVPCQDESIQELGLFRQPNNATITDTATTGGFISAIDTTGGGLTPSRSYVYVKFGAAGLERVAIGDEAAFESTEWDIAMRRFVVRLNSGVSGPSCVVARRAPATATFDTVDAVPAAEPRVEEYMTPAPTCALVSDGSGLPGSPGVALQSFWEYPGCVRMTGNVYVITLADGRSVKFQVLSYYSPSNQALCDTEGRIETPSGAGALRIKWAFLP